MKAWLVPSEEYAARAGRPNNKGRFRFVASMKERTKDRWADSRLEAYELAPAILARLTALEAAGP